MYIYTYIGHPFGRPEGGNPSENVNMTCLVGYTAVRFRKSNPEKWAQPLGALSI